MISKGVRVWFVIVAAVSLMLAVAGCENTESSKLVPPTFYPEEALNQASTLINDGYQLLDSNKVDEAVATFTKIDELIPSGLMSNYHIACAYGRTGQNDKAFEHLDKLLAAGYDSPDNLKYDTDLAGLQADPRWEGIVTKVKANTEAAWPAFASGMPVYDQAPQTFATVDECEAWVKEQTAQMRQNRMAWTTAQYTTAMVDLAAQKMTCMAGLTEDTGYDPELERVREAATILSPYEAWGGVADMVVAETERMMSGSPSQEASDEANYKAGMALSLKYPADDSRRATAYTAANSQLMKVSQSSEYYPAAQVLSMINLMRTPGGDQASLGAEYKKLVAEYGTDKNAYRMISTQFGPETVDATWPIPIELEDIDGKQIQLADYAGKVVLIDFWATWCGPCRAELPTVLAAYDKYHSKGFEIVSISLDYKDRVDLDKYREWIGEQGMVWRHAYSGTGWDTPKVKDYFVSGIPATFLVGKDGTLIAWGEDCRGENLEKTLAKALGSV